jgi:hypothetical protein
VHSSRSRATSDPVAFHNKTWDQADFLSFSVKRLFQNEILFTPPTDSTLTRLLNRLGAEGWEAFSVVKRLEGKAGAATGSEIAATGLTVFLDVNQSSPLT